MKKIALIGALSLIAFVTLVVGQQTFAAGPTVVGKGGCRGSQAAFERVQAAIDAKNYAAWQAAVAEMPCAKNAPTVTEAQFNIMAQAHQLLKEGKVDEAKELLKTNNINGLGLFHGIGRAGCPRLQGGAAFNSAPNKPFNLKMAPGRGMNRFN